MNHTRAFLQEKYDISDAAFSLIEEAECALKDVFFEIEQIAAYNTYKVLEAFRVCNVQNRHMNQTTGYGYSDEGREKLAEVFAHIFNTEAAIVSPLIASGTHAISIALFGLLRPLDTMLSISGRPYDTLSDVIGLNEKKVAGSLADFAIKYQQIDLIAGSKIDIPTTLDQLRLNQSIRIVYIQRSRGYEFRKTLSVEQIGEAITAIRKKRPDVKIVVDNCYGEFTETIEPTDVGADLIIGSLIKNPGGGLAPTGGYLAGTQACIDLVAARLTCPGIGTEIGSYAYGYLPYFQGIYFAPTVVKDALKGAALTSYVFEKLGYLVTPRFDEPRSDITQAVCLHSEKQLIEVVRAVQKASPIDSEVVPYPWDMPGYTSQVIMAAGTFIQGGSIELSADAPIKKPYTAYMQGGLTYENVKLALFMAVTSLNLLAT